MKKVLLFGYYGYQNTGDEAILQTVIQQLRSALPEISLKVLTYKSEETEQKYGVKAVSRNRFLDLIRAIRECDVVVSGGGSILQDVTSSRSLLYYLAIIWLAKKMGKGVMFYGNGLGPINRLLNRYLAKHVLNQVDVITLRDYQSKEALLALGVKKEVHVTADIAFAMEPLEASVGKEILKAQGLDPEKKVIGISVRPWRGKEQYKRVVAKTADHLHELNYQVLFIPMQYPHDYHLSKEICAMMKGPGVVLEHQYSPLEILTLISQLDLMIGMRLHALIFAAIAGVPMVGIEYENKVKSFLQLVGQKSGGVAENLEEIPLWATIEGVLQQDKKYREILSRVSADLHKKALYTKDIFEEFVMRG